MKDTTTEERAESRGERHSGIPTLFSAVRNEAPFLLEWIGYHRCIGFERIIVFSNDCDDGTDLLLEALASEGIVEHYRHQVPDGVAPQANAADIANRRKMFEEGDWVSWLDADEFLVVNVGNGTVAALIERIGGNDGVLIPWRIMGDSGNVSFPGRFVSAHFSLASRRAFVRNFEIKSFFRMGPWMSGLAKINIHRPCVKADAKNRPTFLDGKGSPLDPRTARNKRWLSGADFPDAGNIERSEHGYRLAQINHYTVRTPEHFLLKRIRGRGAVSRETSETDARHEVRYYRQMNRNDVPETAILRFEDATTREIRNLLSFEKVREAQIHAETLVRDSLANLPAGAIDDLLAEAKPATPAREDFPLTFPERPAKKLTDCYSRASCVLEYGSGGSSFVALEKGAQLITVESDASWAARIREALTASFPAANCLVHHVDIGRTGAWGRPSTYEGFRNYHAYPSAVWDLDDFVQPDVVLIDGRFRPACFVTVALRTTRPITVLFDDYIDRPDYHWVEDLSKPVEMVGRMAVFELEPMSLPRGMLTRILSSFANPE